jgi:transcriptional regulator with XRE-family HTH domain
MTNDHIDLRALRLSKGLPQDHIGNRKNVGEIEKGLKILGTKLTRRMARALGVSTDAVFAACVESRRRAGYAPLSLHDETNNQTTGEVG